MFRLPPNAMMRAFATALLSACTSGCGRGDPPSSRPATLGDVKALAEQVRGGACSFGRSRESAGCTHFALPALAWLNDRYLGSAPTRRYACVADAAECLAEFGPAARDATTALIEALERGPNDYDTGDGVIPSRSYVASALGKLEDPRAIEPLGRALRSGVPMDRGPGALESRVPAARGAVVLALARFGPKAIAYAPDFAAILRADERIASAAAEALGATESAEAAPALAAALTKPFAAEAAAKALGALGPSAAVSVPALARLLDSSATPSARTAAAEALGRLDDARAVPALAGALRDPLVREVAARSLGWLGPKAAGAVGPLIDVTRLNTGVVVNPNTGARSYDVQGTRVLAARIAATQALAKIGGARAQTVLYGLAGDPEVGHAARPRRDQAGAVR